MNRRSFFRSLAAAVAGTVVLPPAITFDRCWKYPSYKKVGGIWVVNPEWLDAPYEIEFLMSQGISWRGNLPDVHSIIRKRPEWNVISESIPGLTKINEPFPIRYKSQEDIGRGKNIPAWIEV